MNIFSNDNPTSQLGSTPKKPAWQDPPKSSIFCPTPHVPSSKGKFVVKKNNILQVEKD